ncbi:helix-turn-helix domain-containing protein [Phaeobacter italicus]|uniref:helix-turn-helix domain-containing protein n=1 Tax=Phaeobacter italicus TaxID=481446 RepID=UPI00248E03B8|nr:helix-turn-helix domain-containing protein [Phaeobacter italicus]
MNDKNPNMTPTEAAKLLGVSTRTLSRWHALRVGPARCKIGRKVLYRREAVDAWLAQNETQPTRSFSGGTA